MLNLQLLCVCLWCLFVCISISHAIAPPNPFLTNSVWPLAHHDNYIQASTVVEGPSKTDTLHVEELFDKRLAGALTMIYTSDNSTVWGSSLTHVFKVNRQDSNMYLIDAVEKPAELRRNDTFRGIYAVLSKNNVFYISNANTIAAYTDDTFNDFTSKILPLGMFVYTQASDSERILSVSMSYDGYIIFLTNEGTVGVVNRKLDTLISAQKPLSQSEKAVVTNSMAVDEFGGIYVVTSKYMHRLWWSGSDLYSISPDCTQVNDKSQCASTFGLPRDCQHDSYHGHFTRCQVWSTRYDIETFAIEGRPTKFGSGTTPSIMSIDEPEGRHLYVVIADGSVKQKVVVFDTETGTIAHSEPVNFDYESKLTTGNSYTEQSILVNKDRFMVVQNALTTDGQLLNEALKKMRAENVVTKLNMPEFIQDNVDLTPVLLGDAPRGYQQFRFIPKSRSMNNDAYIQPTWTQIESSCPNAIPTLSEPTNLMYCIGKRSKWGQSASEGLEGGWSLEVLDWDTGEIVFFKPTGKDIRYNTLYAATQVGPDKEILHGSVGGLVRIGPNVAASKLSLVSDVVGGVNPLEDGLRKKIELVDIIHTKPHNMMSSLKPPKHTHQPLLGLVPNSQSLTKHHNSPFLRGNRY